MFDHAQAPAVLIIARDADNTAAERTLLAREGLTVHVCPRDGDSVGRLAAPGPDVALLLADGAGDCLAALVHAFRSRLSTPLLVMVGPGDHLDLAACLAGGADDYLQSPYLPEELTARLAKLLHTRTADRPEPEPPGVDEDPHILTIGSATLFPGSRTLFGPDGRRARLSRREVALARLLVEKLGHAIPRVHIAAALTANAQASTQRGIDLPISRLREKLRAVAADDTAIETVRGFGYRLVPRRARAMPLGRWTVPSDNYGYRMAVDR